MTTFSICFETDKTIISKTSLYTHTKNEPTGVSSTSDASGGDTPNEYAFTTSNMLNIRTRIISNKLIQQYQENYYNTHPHFSHIKLWVYDTNIHFDLDFDFTKVVCIILFINGVYGIHYVVNTDNYTCKQQKQYILENVIPKYKLYRQTDDKSEYKLLINTFDSNGFTHTSTYENIFLEKR